MRPLLILVLLGLLCFLGDLRADSFLLVVKSGTIAKTKPDGKAWDVGFGTMKAWPDPYVKVWVYNAEGDLADQGETAVIWDTFTPVWNQEVATVKAGWKIKLEAWDKDAKRDDLIGKHEFQLTEATIKKGELTLQFGQVEGLHLAFRPMNQAGASSRILLQQPYPGPRSARQLQRSEDCGLAIVLLHGFDSRDDGSSPKGPRPQAWQGSTSPLVRALSSHGDVFAISYPQTTAVEEIATFPELREAIAKIKGMGYEQLVLVGYSAGGLLARHLVEDYPNAGITRVIQVATPNTGAQLAEWGVKLSQVHREQEAFVRSLSPNHRTALLTSRQGRLIPDSAEFVTVVTIAASGVKGDSVVSRKSQWSDDLQQQRIPCVCVQATHLEAMSHDNSLKVLCALASQPQARWSPTKVLEMGRELGISR